MNTDLALQLRAWAKKQSALLMIFGAVLLGFLFPAPARLEGLVSLDTLTTIGIALIFFLHGANLAPKVFLSGVAAWRLHLLVQSSTYVAFPAIGALVYFAGEPWLSADARLGFFFLTALPSTISSAVALAATAGGQVPGAVFNASLSNLAGLLITPALIALIGQAGDTQFDVLSAVIGIAKIVLLPFAVGQAARPLIKAQLAKYKPFLSAVDRGVILLIVFKAFAETGAAGTWSRFSPADYLGAMALAGLLLAIAFAALPPVARAMGLKDDEQITALFCGGTKSLATGAPMAQILFAGLPSVGIIMLPLLIYHPAQLVLGAAVAQRYAERRSKAAAPV
ncbi:MAG: bile acid:sodium symporter family protein [Pseudomonadota bacterium]